jgi:16S rRNA (guanine966-N2)-methyltransferase
MRIISGRLGGRTIKTVSGPGYRPATSKVRQAVFSMLEARGMDWEGAHVLDLFAGSGSLGLEALSRGAAEAWFVEKNRKAAAVIRENVDCLGLSDRGKVLARDLVEVVCRPASQQFDLVFVDPPYGKDMLGPALRCVVENGWLKGQGLVVAETEASLQVDPGGFGGLASIVEKTYGQTRIIVWRGTAAA